MQYVLFILIVIVLFVFCNDKAHGAAMTKMYKRILKRKEAVGLTWDEIAKRANIPLATWMTGLPNSNPTDAELEKLAPVLETTYEYLKYGKE